MLIEFLVKIGAAVFFLVGTVVAVYGTYLMATAYHPFRFGDLIRNISRVALRLFTFRWRSANDLVRDVAIMAEVNLEDFITSLRGIYFLFVGFVLQAIGAVLAVADVILSTHSSGLSA